MQQLANLIKIKTGLIDKCIDCWNDLCYYVCMAFITSHKNTVRMIKQDNPLFYLNDGIVNTPRAGFEINQHCPKEYRMIISECINNGWIKPVANVTERELLFVGLTT